jgi:isocitrate lyase
VQLQHSTLHPQAKAFADGVHAKFPGKLLAYNCSPSFNWAKHLKDEQIATFQQARPLLA